MLQLLLTMQELKALLALLLANVDEQEYYFDPEFTALLAAVLEKCKKAHRRGR